MHGQSQGFGAHVSDILSIGLWYAIVVYWKHRLSMGITVFLLQLNGDISKIVGQLEDGQLKVNQVRCFLKNQSLTRFNIC